VVAPTADDSFFTALTDNTVGVSAANAANLATLQRGGWSIDFTGWASFVGTTNLALGTFDEISLLDPDGAAQPLWHFSRITGTFVTIAQLFRFVFQRDGWIIQKNRGATVAGDSLSIGASINCRKTT